MTTKILTSATLAAALAVQAQPPAPPAPPAPVERLERAAQTFTMMMGGSFLGIGVREVDSAERMKELKLKEERGVEVTTVDADSPASKAGLQKGDVILEYNGQRVEGVAQFIRMVRETPGGRSAKMLVSRSGATQTVMATVQERKPSTWGDGAARGFNMPRIVIPDIPRPLMSWRAGMLGIEAESIEGGLAQYFGVKQGVLVRSVAKDSVAEKAGLKAGDVIIKVGEETVDSPQDISNAIRDRGEKKTLSMTVMREKREQAMSVTFDEAAPAPARRAPARTVRAQEYRF